jgi:hypothetical protein
MSAISISRRTFLKGAATYTAAAGFLSVGVLGFAPIRWACPLDARLGRSGK